MYLYLFTLFFIILVNAAVKVKCLCLMILFVCGLYVESSTCLTLISFKYCVNFFMFFLPLLMMALKGSPYLSSMCWMKNFFMFLVLVILSGMALI